MWIRPRFWDIHWINDKVHMELLTASLMCLRYIIHYFNEQRNRDHRMALVC